jgi:rfaE bifunctional protein nucleotidyltransferase chain/domain
MKTNEKIKTLNEAISWRKLCEKHNEKVVFTNGCFDILHAGHVTYLEEAAQLGNKLIVAINADASVQLLEKSPARPLQSQESRAKVMAALQFVDCVIIFSEPTPKEVIELLTPDILVKGSDYQINNIVGADWVIKHGGEVKTLDFVPGYSTTAIERKIITAHGLSSDK